MGLLPHGESSRRPQRWRFTGLPSGDGSSFGDPTLLFRVQAAFLLGGAVLGLLGVILPHPSSFMLPQLIVLNALSFSTAFGFWIIAPRLPAAWVRFTPAIGTFMVSLSVIFSRDPTSAYAMLYLFPPLYAYYFLPRVDAVLHIAFAALNYAGAVALISALEAGTRAEAGAIFHHFVITIGSLIVIGLMLTFLRQRVEALMNRVFESARTDLATGLLNARGLQDALDAELDRARMSAHRVSVLSVRLSGLRDLQKRHGHRAGDELIKTVGELLKDSTRLMDHVARTGVTEYTVVLPETDEGTAFLLAEQVLARARRTFREQQVATAASIGVAAFPKHAADPEGLTQAAASAAEAAGALGGDRAVVFSTELEGVLGGDPTRGLREQRTHLSTVLSLAEVLDLRDARTASHSMAVARYAELIGQHLGMPDSRLKRLRLAGLLHDIGKVGIADSIFDKPGPLSPSEWDEVRRHPELAARILGASDLSDIREWILCRHEQPDGHGYPRGLSGEAIPLESRILAVAESYDAMTNDRPYRPARSKQEAIAELGRYSGSQFDGLVVDALVRVLDQRGVELPSA
jgi:diguanylate cyclase (GGDEF)-like protein/putative nucleotidyltransferase with HDIG domain